VIQHALLNVNARPWANVWLDGRAVGETPLANLRVPVGEHELIFRHPDLGERRVVAVVEPGGPTRVTVDLRE
jgi:serine/threonine-protein kinase